MTSELGSLIDKAHGFAQIYEQWMRRRLGDGESGVTLARLRILLLLRENGAQQMKELARRAGVVPRTLTAFIDGLQRDGLVSRTSHVTDRRATVVTITALGHKTVENKSQPYWEAKNFLFEALSGDERRVMSDIYDRWMIMVAADLDRMGDR